MGLDKQDFFKWKQDAFFIQITIEDAETSLSSYKAYWAMAPDSGSSPSLVKTTSGHFGDAGGITWVNGNIARIQIDESDTAQLTVGTYYHELTIEDGSGNSVVVATGEFDLREAIFPFRS